MTPREPSAAAALERVLTVVDEREATVQAFEHLDVERARAEARTIDQRGSGELIGLALGVKDIFDTSDQPTAYGSPIYAGFRPAGDASAVALLRSAGAVCVGKTVTAEFASGISGKTRNPHRPTHTPGGSSSGSAAAVAAGMADIALGSQTLGSTIRPASFCGVYGFKPTHGLVSVAGMKPVAPSLDTVGWFARSVEDIAAVFTVLTGRRSDATARAPRSISLLVTDQSEAMSSDSLHALERALACAAAGGAEVGELRAPSNIDGLSERARLLMAYEEAQALAWERATHRDELSDYLNELLALGDVTAPEERDAILAIRRSVWDEPESLFHGAELLIYPAASGEAPEGLESTGDRRFQGLITVLGLPSISVPGFVGATGLPVGVQLIGRKEADGTVLAAAQWLDEAIAQSL